MKNNNKNQKLNKRQDAILAVLGKTGQISIAEIKKSIETNFASFTKATLNRDLATLIKFGLVVKQGSGRQVTYGLSPRFNLLMPIDVKEYFAIEIDKRKGKEKFNHDIFPILNNIFTEEEQARLENLTNEYRASRKKQTEGAFKKEMERLTIELSWKSSQIEGNTYSLLETETLLKESKEAPGHKKEEATMIINHKRALDYIVKHKDGFKSLSVAKIEHIHSLLVDGLDVRKNLRKSPVGITGTKYKPLDNEWQIKEVMEKTCDTVNKEKDPFVVSVLLSAMIAYIQPFEDGNKRTSRLMGNAVLLARDICPLSYRNVDETEYKKAVILFYEQNNINYFKQLFIEQFEFAVKNYFTA